MGHRRSAVEGVDRSVTYRLLPTKKQHAALSELLTWQCRLYNAALEERRGAWRWEGRQVTLYDQINGLTGAGEWAPELARFGRRVSQGTLVRLDDAFSGFFRRVRAGDTPGFPRFRPQSRFDSVQWSNHLGSWKLTPTGKGTYGRLYVQGVGHISVKLHRRFEGAEPRRLVVRRVGAARRTRFEATISFRGVKGEKLPATGRSCGIDVGVAVLAAVADDHDNVELVENPRHLANRRAELTAAQQALATCEKTGRRDGGRRMRAKARVARAHARVRNARRDGAHQLSCRLVADFDHLFFEKLSPAVMTRSAKGTMERPGTNVAQKSGLNRAILDAGWGQLVRFVTYKAESAGRSMEWVDAPYTSTTCARCGHTDPSSRRSRDDFWCTGCGHEAHADANAAQVVLAVGTGRLVVARPRRRTSRPGPGHQPVTAGRDVA